MDTEVDRHGVERAYSKIVSSFRDLETEVKHILESASRQQSLKVAGLESRIKTIDSIVEKAVRKGVKDPMMELSDILGVRIIGLLRSDMGHFEALIRDEFEIIEVDDKTVHGDGLGYRSEHFICKLKKELVGRRYDEIKNFKFEIQLRTLCMHAWAALSHHLQYKSEEDVPVDLQQSLRALSGLFFVADSQFEQFVKVKDDYRERAAVESESLNAGPIDLNMDTFKAYASKRFPDRSMGTDDDISDLISDLKHFNITTINQIDNFVKKRRSDFADYEKESLKSGKFNAVGLVRSSYRLENPEYSDYRNAMLGGALAKRKSTSF